MIAAVGTADGVFLVDVEAEEVIAHESGDIEPPRVDAGLPRVVAAAACGSTVVAVVARRPPLAVSHDAGSTWREAGGGLPPGRAVAISATNPDDVVYASRNRLFVSTDGGRFWRALAVELPEIRSVEVREAEFAARDDDG